MNETMLLAAVVGSRAAWEALQRMPTSGFSDAGRALISAAGEQYTRDAALTMLNRDVLTSQLARKFGDSDAAAAIVSYYDELPTDISEVNVVAEYSLLQAKSVANELAVALVSGKAGPEVDALISKYQTLTSPVNAAGPRKFRLDEDDYNESSEQRIPLAPTSLDTYIGGGVCRGHNIVVYGRPDSGKSLFAINAAAYAIHKNFRVLYVANEEPASEITRRLVARLVGCQIGELRDRSAIAAGIATARKRGYDRWHLLHEAGASAGDIRTAALQVKPDLIVVDQLKNLRAADDNRALQLDRLARDVRELGIACRAVTMSVTQAGDSASHKLVLGMNDVEWSNTGIPGAADLMIGIGVDQAYDSEGKRMLSIPKNKINGRHGAFPVWVRPAYSEMSATPRGG